ncbi:MFS general substrate transporter [Annulohypoxylon maeteangense]|uniref:MFS general substrate transporter n=1 Tax=Annulohypoxylon maeteangense TaxID=1927788 RepID=UPI0020085866|nr:MFS general substrate transporter [Annulohypoxylon maeteangense]KAI0884550.1 MFS general substrate transporter [Annulohypoxylon maeteangense]
MGGYFSSLNATTGRVADEIECDLHDPERAVQSVIDYPGLDKFQWKVWWVAASGFFTTSYSIFAVNVISPALSYVYPECTHSWSTNSLVINLTTLTGTMFGMLIFGHLADRYGRKAVYGLELSIVVVATVGMTSASSGHLNSMNVYGWIGFWRALLGIGLGAEYPLSAIIATEWSSTKSRGRMIAAVFLMQSLGQLAAYALGLAILRGISSRFGLSPEETDYDVASPVIDVVWRTTIGIGAVPALISLFLRRMIPETPHYLVEKGELVNAVAAVGRVLPLDATLQPTDHSDPMAQLPSERPMSNLRNQRKSRWESIVDYMRQLKDHLVEQGRWRALAGVMATWYLLDLAYYGLGLDNPKLISTIWLSDPPPQSNVSTSLGDVMCNNASWRADPAQPNITIYEMLQQDSMRNIITISSGALPGSIVILLAIDYLPRTTWMGWMFVALAALFAINGGTFFVTFETDKHALTMTLYVLAQFVFNLGPNTMTFMLPAELFATKYRGTFYGLAAASGKLGAITILLITNMVVYKGDYSHKFAALLLGFCPAMLLGAFITWVWIPEVQYPRGYDDKPERGDDVSEDGVGAESSTFRQKLKLRNRPLADIAQNPGDGQILGMRRNIGRLFRAARPHGSNDIRRRHTEDRISRRGNSIDQQNMIYYDHEQGGRMEEADVGDGLGIRQMHYVT